MMATDLQMLPEPQAVALLAGYGIAYPEHGLARGQDEAVEWAKRLGYPVVLKVVSPEVVHKSDLGGVALDLDSPQAVVDAYARIVQAVRLHDPTAQIEGILVCRQTPPGLEVIVGGLHDAMFGPTVMFGLGGIFTEVLHDVSFRLVPMQRADAEEMIQETRGHALLSGTRGQPGYDIDALIDLLLSVSRLMGDRPDIIELDLNPVRLFPQGLLALDARMMVCGV